NFLPNPSQTHAHTHSLRTNKKNQHHKQQGHPAGMALLFASLSAYMLTIQQAIGFTEKGAASDVGSYPISLKVTPTNAY
ncbi:MULTISPECIES: hypothetical protein, partial [unclassified Herbaspirillum]|uniref:hypothetical protein n=1 Tax=unclassified Herbaspirillum TaxID=2624150 RepID=UPI001C85C684